MHANSCCWIAQLLKRLKPVRVEYTFNNPVSLERIVLPVIGIILTTQYNGNIKISFHFQRCSGGSGVVWIQEHSSCDHSFILIEQFPLSGPLGISCQWHFACSYSTARVQFKLLNSYLIYIFRKEVRMRRRSWKWSRGWIYLWLVSRGLLILYGFNPSNYCDYAKAGKRD